MGQTSPPIPRSLNNLVSLPNHIYNKVVKREKKNLNMWTEILFGREHCDRNVTSIIRILRV